MKKDLLTFNNVSDVSPEKLVRFNELINDIAKKSDSANIEYKKITIYDSEAFEMLISSGREKRSIIVNDLEHAQNLANIDFEKYIILNDYLAICSYELGFIEALIQPIITIPPHMFIRRLLGTSNTEENNEGITIEQSKEIGNVSIIIGFASKECLSFFSQIPNSRYKLSIKITGLSINTHDKAVEILKKISDSIFFQIELLMNLPVSLVKEGKSPLIRARAFGYSQKLSDAINFPSTQYDPEPISLYWYGRSATKMPLLQFLAYYQAIEYYFPIYSEIEAKNSIKNLLKNPTFNVHKDADLNKLLTCVKSKLGKGYDKEKLQLKATLSQCIDIVDLKSFIGNNKVMKDYFSSKEKKVSKHKIMLTQNDSEIISSVMERIYEIRCKIVHTKASESQGDIEKILPYSKEADLLDHDINLIKYISQQVIISSGSLLNI